MKIHRIKIYGILYTVYILYQVKTLESHDKRSPENAMMMDFFKKRGNSAMNDYLARFRLP